MKYLTTGVLLASSILISMSSNANAKDDKNKLTPIAKKVQEDNAAGLQNIMLSSQTVASGFAPQGLELKIDGDSSSIAANFLSNRDLHLPGLYSTQTLAIKLKAPINKSTKTANFITSNGFANNFSANLTWSRVKSRYAAPKTAAQIADNLNELIVKGTEECERKLKEAGQSISACDQAGEFQNHLTKDEQQRHIILANFNQANFESVDAVKGLTETEVGEIYDALLESGIKDAAVWYYGADIGLGFQNYTFRNPMDASKRNRDKFSYSVSGFAGVTPTAKDFYIGGGVKHAVSFKDSTKKTRCGAADEDGFQDCLTAPFAPPVKNIDSTVFALARYRTKMIKQMPDLAVEVKAVYDIEDNIFGVAAPIYLFQGQDGNLRGGIRLDWDEDSDVKIGIFLGSSFDLLSGVSQ